MFSGGTEKDQWQEFPPENLTQATKGKSISIQTL